MLIRNSFVIKEDCLIVNEGVAVLDKNALKNREVPTKKITKVILPKSLEVLKCGFEAYTNLREVDFSGNSLLRKIPDNCFSGLQNLKRIVLPKSIEVIGNRAFSQSGLETLEIQARRLQVGDNAFSTSKLKSFKLKVSETSVTLGEYCFGFCESLESVEITTPEGVEMSFFGQCCFFNCINLKKLILECSTEIIPISFLRGCYNLRDLQLPKLIKYVDYLAFMNCVNVRLLELPNSVEKIADSSFSFWSVDSKTMIKFLDNYWEVNEFVALIKAHNEQNPKSLDFTTVGSDFKRTGELLENLRLYVPVTLGDFIKSKFPEEFIVKEGFKDVEAIEETSLF